MKRAALFAVMGTLTLMFGGSAGVVKAAIITSLYNTGVSDSGSVLPDASVDPHYMLTSVPIGSGLGANAYIADSNVFPLDGGNWMADSSTSKWIAPTANQSTFVDAGHTGFYTYQTTFDLTGFDPNTAVITGQWSTDNAGEDILINGISTGVTHKDGSVPSYAFFSSFTINSGFKPGVNTLDFVVDNAPLNPSSPSPNLYNPTGLRVELSGTAMATPEPSTLTLQFFGALGLLLCHRYRRRKAART